MCVHAPNNVRIDANGLAFVARVAVLQKFEKYGGLVVRNALYGSSGYINAPQVGLCVCE